MLRIRLKILFLLLFVPAVCLAGSRAKPSCRFTDQTARLGLKPGNQPAAWADFNNDNWIDLYTGGAIWFNEKGKSFRKLKVPGRGIAADFDNDGWVDIYSYTKKRLLKNQNAAAFTKIDLPEFPKSISLAACCADFNNDGFADIYTTGYEDYKAGLTYPDFLLLNRAGKSFSLEIHNTKYRARGVTACDFDQDGDIDIYISNYRLQPNLLLINDGKGSFTDKAEHYNAVATSKGFRGAHSISACWADFNNDGYFDLFAGNFAHRDSRGNQPQSRFLQNAGPEKNYTFTSLGPRGVFYQESYASCAAGDYDNDGDIDLYFTTVYATASFGKKNHPVLFANDGHGRFSDVTQDAGLEKLGPTYQGAWADFDRDGDLDLLTDGKLFVNSGCENRWLTVRLRGDPNHVNTLAIGAQVRIPLNGQVLTRQVEAGTGQGSQNSPVLHFGLGTHKDPVQLDILWPDGTKQHLKNVQPNTAVEVKYSTKIQPSPRKQQGQ